MLKKYNDNIICRFFKAMAAFWNSAAEYPIFVILVVIALLVILPLFGVKLSNATNVVLNIIIFCAVAAGGFVLFRLKGSQMAAFTFAVALLSRLCLVFVLETSTPQQKIIEPVGEVIGRNRLRKILSKILHRQKKNDR
jgi:hypothetical protein